MGRTGAIGYLAEVLIEHDEKDPYWIVITRNFEARIDHCVWF